MMHHAALQFPPRPGEQVIAVANNIQPGINHVFFGPGNRRRTDIGPFANTNDEAVKNLSIKPIPEYP
jgi:hypothetical protein